MADSDSDSDSPPSPKKRLKTTTDSDSESKPQKQCAICFAGGDDERASRGEIDCCDHYFCFLCIVEWARTESRCPLCRRRFAAVRRPPKPGVFACERLVSVPVRDQACGANGASDPYAEVSCNVCHGTGDDCLLLLCDLCDTASHTYCVGLGVTVPEGDWFCQDCALSQAERANSEKETEEDIGREFAGLVAEKSPPRVSSFPKRRNPPSEQVSHQGTKKLLAGPAQMNPSDSGARTLDRCRGVHSRIRAMRENWNALRSGSLSFSSPVPRKPCRYGQKNETDEVTSSSTGCSQSKDQKGSDSYDVNRAWKMMDLAKSTTFGGGKTVNLQSCKVSNSNVVRKTQKISYSSSEPTELETPFNGLESDKEKYSRVRATCCSSTLSRLLENSSPSENITSIRDNTCQQHCSTGPQVITNQESSDIANSKPDGLACSASQVASGSFNSGSERNITLRIEDKQHDDAKGRIQSLVKLNLKILTKEKRLGVEEFKEIARFATHTTLAACRLEHRKKYGAYSFPSSVICSHSGPAHEIPVSNFMSCQECFNIFVKDIVTQIMHERVVCSKSS